MSDELREALDWLDGYNWHGGPSLFYDERLKRHETVRAAARERLAQLEADPELVERLHNVVHSWVPEFNWPAVEQMTLELLAAISTPTPETE